jgi:hypothetical protein
MATDSVSPYYSPMLDRTSTISPPVAGTGYANYTSGIQMVPNNVGLPAYVSPPSGYATQTSSIVGTTGPPPSIYGSSGGTAYVPNSAGGITPTTVMGNPPADTAATSSGGISGAAIGGGLLLLLLFL